MLVLIHYSCHQNCNNSDKIWLMQRRTLLSRSSVWSIRCEFAGKMLSRATFIIYFLPFTSQPMFPSGLQ